MREKIYSNNDEKITSNTVYMGKEYPKYKRKKLPSNMEEKSHGQKIQKKYALSDPPYLLIKHQKQIFLWVNIF